MDKEEWLIGSLLVLLIVGLLGGTAYLAYVDARQWEEFKIKHNCKKVGEMAGSVQTGVGVNPSNGQPVIVTTSEPSKEGYLCDDGITYWR